MSTVQLLIPDKYYLKDPNSSVLGKKIIAQSVDLFDELGFEEFTFKKLAQRISSTEASIYRYFENKLKLLLYLSTLYWRWMEYLIEIRVHFENDPKKMLKEILKILTSGDELKNLQENASIDIKKLRSVVMIEADKTYLTKKVDEINNEGLFRGYKDLCHRIALVIQQVRPDYKYPHAISSTLLEAAHQQVYFAQHLPSLTEIDRNGRPLDAQVYDFLDDLMEKIIN